MARRKPRKPRHVAGTNSSHSDAVEQLQDAVGRLIARRLLREWAQSRGSRDTAPPPAAPKRPG